MIKKVIKKGVTVLVLHHNAEKYRFYDPLARTTQSPKLGKKKRSIDDACGIAQNLT